jgi:hypothetical protein
MSEPDLPEGVLLIRYQALSPESLVRLGVSQAIGRLLENSDKSTNLANLNMSPEVQEAFEAWLNSEEAKAFWQLSDHVVISIKPYISHIIIGTRYLLDDLAQLQTSNPPNLSQLDLVWQAAGYWLAHR